MIAFYNNRRNLLAITLLLILTPALYKRLNRAGYIPPISYFFSQANNLDSTHLSAPKSRLLNYERSLAEIIVLPVDKSQTAILIQKSQYQLTLYYQKRAVKSYPIVLGSNPVGDKFREGDNKTPEGVFKIKDLYPHPSWFKFIWLDYPNQSSWRKHLQAKKTGKIDFFSPIGGEIGIHGVPQNSDYLIEQQSNWTWGSISLKNQDINELYSVLEVGTIVEIIP